jgi:hypothetical protein
MWVTRKGDLARRGEVLLAKQCDIIIDKWIKELVIYIQIMKDKNDQ